MADRDVLSDNILVRSLMERCQVLFTRCKEAEDAASCRLCHCCGDAPDRHGEILSEWLARCEQAEQERDRLCDIIDAILDWKTGWRRAAYDVVVAENAQLKAELGELAVGNLAAQHRAAVEVTRLKDENLWLCKDWLAELNKAERQIENHEARCPYKGEVERLKTELSESDAEDATIARYAHDICHGHGLVVGAEREGWTSRALREMPILYDRLARHERDIEAAVRFGVMCGRHHDPADEAVACFKASRKGGSE